LLQENWNQAPGFERILGGGAGEHYSPKRHVEKVSNPGLAVFGTFTFFPVRFQVVNNFKANIVELFQVIARRWK